MKTAENNLGSVNRFLFLFTILFFVTSVTFSSVPDPVKPSEIKFNLSVTLNSNGMASIPAFSLGKPAIVGSMSVSRKRFSWDPNLAYGLDLKPWYIDNWFHYKIVDRERFELRTGFNASAFFSRFEETDENVLQSQRYFAFEMATTYKFSSPGFISLMYWRDSGRDYGSLKGHFIDLTAEKSEIKLGDNLLAAINLQLFYIDYDGANDGLFFSPKLSSSLRQFPVSLFFQATQALESNITPWPGFRWNVGLTYTIQ